MLRRMPLTYVDVAPSLNIALKRGLLDPRSTSLSAGCNAASPLVIIPSRIPVSAPQPSILTAQFSGVVAEFEARVLEQ